MQTTGLGIIFPESRKKTPEYLPYTYIHVLSDTLRSACGLEYPNFPLENKRLPAGENGGPSVYLFDSARKVSREIGRNVSTLKIYSQGELCGHY